MTTVLILPATALLFINREKLSLQSLRIVGASLLVFIAVLLLFYSYLPTRASMNPMLNWGNPDNIERIFRHISGQQYSVWLFSSIEAAEKQLINFYENLPNEFLFVIFVFVAFGLVEFFLRSKILFFFTVVCFITTVLYSINYNINDLAPYFLLAYYSLAIISFFGIIVVFKFLRYLSLPRTAASIAIVIAILAHGAWNFPQVNQSGIRIYEDYTKAILTNVELNSIIISYQWDYFVSPSYYFQYAEEFRNDVTVIDKELLRRSWYYSQLKLKNRSLFSGFDNDVTNFINSLKPFEDGGEYNSEVLESLFRKIQSNLIAYNIGEHDIYLGPEMISKELKNGELSLPKGYKVIPHLLLFKVVRGNNYVPAPDPNFTLRMSGNNNKYTDFIENITAEMLANRALYELSYRKTDRAKLYIQKIRSDFPNFSLPDQLKPFVEN
jgi:hypothetical protein